MLPADVYNRMGGQQALTPLLNPNGTTSWNVTMLDTALSDAWNYCVAAVGVQADLAGYTDAEIRANFPQLITVTAQKSLRFSWIAGSGGQATPDGIKEIDGMAELQLEKLAERRRKHGAANFSPAPAQRVSQVNMNPHHDRMTLCGFRSTGGLI